MNNIAMDKVAYQRWLAAVRVGGPSPRTIRDDLKSLPSTDQQDTTVQRLPKDVVQRLRERAMRHAVRHEDPTMICRPSDDLLERARRLDMQDTPLEVDEETQLWHKYDPNAQAQAEAQAEAFGKELQSSIREKRALALSRAAAAAPPSQPTMASRFVAFFVASLVAVAYLAVSQWR
jgi:hypothetical protein